MIISVSASVAVLFQAIAMALCPVNQFQSATANVCYEITPSQFSPHVDAQFLDLKSLQYLQTKWLDENTMLNTLQTATTTYCWYDDQTDQTFSC